MDSSAEIKRYADIAWRRKWWVAIPTLLAVAVSLVIVGTTPKVYRATTIILVTRPNVPEDIMRSTAAPRIEERMRSLQVQIFSRRYLEQIAREFALIPAGARADEIEKTYQELRTRIIPELEKGNFSWFRISVEDGDATRAAAMANRIAALFIEQNTLMRASQAAGTLQATENWKERYGAELAQRDQAIAEFKQQNLYELPDQQPANLQLLDSSKSRVAQLTSDIQSRTDHLIALRAQRQAQRAFDAAPSGPDAIGADDPRMAKLHREIADLLENYTEENPLVKRKRQQIAELVPMLSPAVPGAPRASAATARLDPTSLQIASIENELKSLERDRAREQAASEVYRGRIAEAPERQQRLLGLTRDYDTVKQQFETVVAQSEQAQRVQDLEESKSGEQFQIQDFAFPPPVPFAPDVLRYVLFGLALGLALGTAAAWGREVIDQTIRSQEEFSPFFPDLPVFGVIPNLDIDARSRVHSPRPAGGTGPQVA